MTDIIFEKVVQKQKKNSGWDDICPHSVIKVLIYRVSLSVYIYFLFLVGMDLDNFDV